MPKPVSGLDCLTCVKPRLVSGLDCLTCVKPRPASGLDCLTCVKPSPESGPDFLICATTAQQRCDAEVARRVVKRPRRRVKRPPINKSKLKGLRFEVLGSWDWGSGVEG